MEGSDETGATRRIQSSFGNCSSFVAKQSNHQMGINGQMQNLSVDDNGSSSSKRPSGIPPSHPNFPPFGSHFAVPKMASHQQMGAQNFTMGTSHTRSLSQPSFFSFDHLPPLSPSPFKESPQSSVSDRNVNDLPTEESSSNSLGSLVPAVPLSGGNMVHTNEGLPPRRGHRRSSSDIPLGFTLMSQPLPPNFTPPGVQGIPGKDRPVQLIMKQEFDRGGVGNAAAEGVGERKPEGEVVDDLFSAYINLDNIDALNSSSVEDKDMDSRASGTRTNYSSENEVESSTAGNSHGIHGATLSNSSERKERGKRCAPGDIAPTGRHFRSLSMDSFMGNLNFSDESPKLPPSPGIRSAQHSPSHSVDGNTNKFSLGFGSGEFSPAELKKIMANEKLAEIAMADPKRAKRILANRQSAARSKERKLKYIAELEHKVQTLQTEATTLSAQLTLLQRDSAGLTSQNNELRFRLQAMEQQAQLKDALNEALTAEVQRLKLATGELGGEAPPNRMLQQLMPNHQIFQMQPSHCNMYQLQHQQQQQSDQKHTQQPQQNQAAQCQQDAEAA